MKVHHGFHLSFSDRLFFIISILVALIVTLFLLLWPRATVSHPASAIDAFAVCLNQKGVTMYGTDTCPNCQNQKKLFGDAFDKINYVNCYFHQKECDDKSITAYPAWIAGGKQAVGVQTFADLASISGCKSPIS